MSFCGKCGNEVNPSSSFCPRCGAPVQSPTPSYSQPYVQQPSQGSTPTPGSAPMVNAMPFLIWSWIMTFVCCLPLGIVGIIFSNKAKNATNYDEAQRALSTARLMCILGTILGAVGVIIWIILMAVADSGSY